MKKFYKENRVFVILMGVVLVCVAIIIAILASYVFKSNSGDRYGNRLDGIEDVIIEEDFKTDMESKIVEMDKVESAKINVHGKIVNFNVVFTDEATVNDAKNVGVKCLEFFEESYKNFYDIEFLFSKNKEETEEDDKEEKETSDKFPFLGYIKAGATTISWSNNSK